MPNYTLYSPDVEVVADDEQETYHKIVELMSSGMANVREKTGKSVRISHAKTSGVLKGTLTVAPNLPQELAQGLFSKAGTFECLVRLAAAPGEYTDDSKLGTARGLSIKILNVPGPKLPGSNDNTQDFVLDTGKEFLAGGPKEFLQAFTANAEVAPKLSDDVKGAVSKISEVTNAGLKAIGIESQKLDFFGHPQKNPMAEPYFSQNPMRFGDYIAKLGVYPVMPGAADLPYEAKTPDALREATAAYFKSHAAEFSVRVQLNVDLEEMPIENAQAHWSESLSQYQEVARISLPVQSGWDAALDGYAENFSFNPANSIPEFRPLGGIARARLVAYKALFDKRMQQNGATQSHAESLDSVPA